MRIGIDASPILKQRAGVGSYVYHLIDQLSLLDRENQYVLFYCHHSDVKDRIMKPENPNFESKTVRFPTKIMKMLWASIRLPKVDWFVGKVDLYHSTAFYLNPTSSGKSLLTIFDLNFLALRKFTLWSGRWHYAIKMKDYAKRCDGIITVSESSKEEIVRLLEVPPEKVVVTYGGYSEKFRPQGDGQDRETVMKKYRIGGDFILYVGTLEPRKNLKGLIEAYARSRAKEDFLLVLAGGTGWNYKHIFRLVEQLSLRDRVIFCGYVPEPDLPALYRGASLFAYPSFYEGFGLPPLEAMACGTPVVVSDTTSLPEVVGDAGIYVDPLDIEQIAASIDTVLSDSQLARTLRQRGLERAKLFSWERTAKETLELYLKIARQ
ncbi:MAG: glycosyltransferase family 1 protein [Candidatus Zixiibacteriota bacterium]